MNTWAALRFLTPAIEFYNKTSDRIIGVKPDRPAVGFMVFIVFFWSFLIVLPWLLESSLPISIADSVAKWSRGVAFLLGMPYFIIIPLKSKKAAIGDE